MRFYFIRHGESEANLRHEFSNTGQKHPLTENGMRQAEALAAVLAAQLAGNVTPHDRNKAPVRIFSSPLLRAMQTAEIVARVLGTGYQVSDALREYDVGIYEGRSDEAAWEIFQQVQEDWFVRGNPHSRMEGGESLVDIQARFLPFIEELARGPEGMSYILISHGGVYFAALWRVLSNLNVDRMRSLPFPNTGCVLAEKRGEELVCLDWCGGKIEEQRLSQ